MDLSGDDLDSVTRTIMAEAGENATPASSLGQFGKSSGAGP
jgi:hypothetical protein